MTTDDCCSRSNIFIASENLFPDIFNSRSKKLNPEAVCRKEYFNIKSGNTDNIDIFGLPTEKLNAFKLSERGMTCEPCGCGELNRKIAEAAKLSDSANGKMLAGVIGSSGIYICPFSETSFTELISAYDEQVNGLNGTVDLYILYNISSMSDMRAALLSCKKTEKPVYVIISRSETDSEEAGGISALGGLVTAQEMGAAAFGVSCDNYGSGAEYSETVKELFPYAKIPIIIDLKRKFADTKDISEISASEYVGYFSAESDEMLNRELTEKFNNNLSVHLHDDFFVFTYYGYTFFLEADTTEISEPISCHPDMGEEISEICKTPCDVLRVEINSNDDAIDFAENAHMSSLPVMFRSENPLALKMALMLYQGIALIDSDTLIPENELEEMCRKYGAVVY